jgi:hypothetical protein
MRGPIKAIVARDGDSARAHRQSQDEQTKDEQGDGTEEVTPQNKQPTFRGTEIPYRWIEYGHPVGHGNDVLGVARQITGPFFEHFGLHPAIEKNNSLLDPDVRVEEPVGGFQDILQSLADLFIPRNGLNVHFAGYQRLFFLAGGRFCRDIAGFIDCFLCNDHRGRQAANST